MDLSEFAGTPNSEKNNLPVEQLDMATINEQNEADIDLSQMADAIWNEGSAFSYMYKSCERLHVGDQRIIKIMLLSFAATKILNSYGMHVTVSGDAGTGKSHVVSVVILFLPPDKVKSGRMSDKALFHHQFESGCVVVLDDQAPTDDMQELVKESTTNFHKETTYYSVKNGSPIKLTIQPETVFWMVKVEIVGDEQIQDRMFNMHTDNSTEQLDAIKDSIVEAAKNPEQVVEDTTAQDISHRIWNLMPKAYVSIPWADYVGNEERPDARNLNLFFDLIRASALFHAPIRPRGKNIGEFPTIEATYHDFLVASKLMNPLMGNIGGSQKLGTDTNQQIILDFLEANYPNWVSSDPIPSKDIRTAIGMKPTIMTYALKGRNGSTTEGLGNICPAVEVVPMTVPNKAGNGTHQEKGIIWNSASYKAWKGSTGHFIIKDEYREQMACGYTDEHGCYTSDCAYEVVEYNDLTNDSAVEFERIENAKKRNGVTK